MTTTHCTQCGEGLAPGAKFCSMCGRPVQESRSPAVDLARSDSPELTGSASVRILQDIWNLSDGSDTASAFPLVPDSTDPRTISEARNGFPAGPEVWRLAWSMRRQLWFDVIGSGLLEVILRHDGETGEGSALFCFTASDGEEDVVMLAGGFERSDAMHAYYSDDLGLFEWQDYRLHNLEFEDVDEAELYEHSFSSVDRVVLSPHRRMGRKPWSEVAEQLQADAVAVLVADLEKQTAEYEEIVMDHLDVFVSIAVCPGTYPGVVEQILQAVPEAREVLRSLWGGAPGARDLARKVCTACGSRTSMDAGNCPECGAALDDAAVLTDSQLGLEAFQRGDTSTALGLWRRAAEAGDSEAMRHLAIEARDGGEIDQAISLFTAAGELGNARALYQLGALHYNRGDIADARKAWRQGAAAGDPDAMYFLAALAEDRGDEPADIDWYASASMLGSVEASERLATRAMAENAPESEVARLWRVAAEQGSFDGCGLLAARAIESRSYEEVLMWCDRAIAQPLSRDEVGAEQLARVHLMRANALSGMGFWVDALESLEVSRSIAVLSDVDLGGLIAELRTALESSGG